MSKVLVERAFAKDSFPVADDTVNSGWMPGQAFKLNNTGDAVVLGNVDEVLFIGIDAADELNMPPTGALMTGIYGSGTKFIIDHTEEVEAGSSERAYDASVESASLNANLYIDASGKFTAQATGSVKGKMFQKPTAENNYGLGVILRF